VFANKDCITQSAIDFLISENNKNLCKKEK
jgi:hypothetical protein